jgi:hypothetical protein
MDGMSRRLTKQELEQLQSAINSRRPTGQSLAGTEGAEPQAELVTTAPGGSSNLSSNLSGVAGVMNASGGSDNPASGAIGGAAAGASVGGAPGAVVGGVLGTIGALAANKAKKKALARQIEAEKFKAISEIHRSSGQQEAAGIQNMIAGLRGAFLR